MGVNFKVPDIVPILDEILYISPDGAVVLSVQVHQVEVVGIVDSLVFGITHTRITQIGMVVSYTKHSYFMKILLGRRFVKVERARGKRVSPTVLGVIESRT